MKHGANILNFIDSKAKSKKNLCIGCAQVYEQLERDRVTCCNKQIWGDDYNFMYAYYWMAEQMS